MADSKQFNQALELLQSFCQPDDKIAAIDCSWRFAFFNESYELEYKRLWREPKIGDNLLELLAPWPEDLKNAQAVWQRALNGERFTITTAFGPDEAAREYYEIKFSPLYGEDGQLLGAAHISRNVTERIKTEESLKRSEARFALLSETAGALLVTTDPQALMNELCRKVMLHLDCDVFFNFMVYDEAAGRMRLNACAGIPEEEARRIEWLDYGVAVCGCVARDRLRVIAEDILQTPDARTELVKSYGVQAYCCHPLMAGERLIGTLSFGATRRARFSVEDVELMQAVSHQVSVAMERIQREAALKESEERLSRAQEIAHLGSWELDLVNNDLIWSDEVYRIFGLQPQEFGATYEAFLDAVHPEDRDAVNEAYSSSLREGRDSYEIEHRVVRKLTGDVRYVHEKCAHFRDESGRIIRSVGMVHDVTDLKQAQQDLQQLNATLESRIRKRTAELEAANKELAAFSYSVSHDLRAPLRGIDGFSRLLLERYADKVDETGKDYLMRVRNGAVRMGRLIDDMLNLSRIGHVEPRKQAVNLSALAQSVIDDLRHREPERKVGIDIATNLIVQADSGLMRIMLDNLLGNAWKFTGKKDDARIEMGAADKDGERVFYLKDNGAGFDATYANKLFSPFQRLHNETEFAGTGIGLATVQRIITRHGGRIWAESQPDQGATFYFMLEKPA